jgi:hypothetical protein
VRAANPSQLRTPSWHSTCHCDEAIRVHCDNVVARSAGRVCTAGTAGRAGAVQQSHGCGPPGRGWAGWSGQGAGRGGCSMAAAINTLCRQTKASARLESVNQTMWAHPSRSGRAPTAGCRSRPTARRCAAPTGTGASSADFPCCMPAAGRQRPRAAAASGFRWAGAAAAGKREQQRRSVAPTNLYNRPVMHCMLPM